MSVSQGVGMHTFSYTVGGSANRRNIFNPGIPFLAMMPQVYSHRYVDKCVTIATTSKFVIKNKPPDENPCAQLKFPSKENYYINV